MNTLLIGIYERTLRFLEINAQREITFIKSVDTPFSFSECFKFGNYDESFISEACSLLKSTLKNINLSNNKVFLLLDTSYSFLNVIPIDFNDSEPNISSFIVWDISNYYPENYKNFSVNYYKLENYKFAKGVKLTLIVAIDNSILEIIRKIFHNCRIQINMFDLDHFSADKYANSIFINNTNSKEIISIGCKRNKIEISITGQRNLRYYDFINFRDVNYKNKLTKLISGLKREVLSNRINNAMVFGEDYATDVCKFLSSKFSYINFKMPNPFEVFPFADKCNINGKIKTEGNKFIPLFGLFLKGYNK
ncbi:MAG: hypothetical protein N2490_06570 [Ignavibacteria bacterium]|nr:hypothetical protein [Ignavibacteria bacterium]